MLTCLKILCMGIALALLAAAGPAQPPPVTSGPHLTGDQVTLPLVLVKGYPFVEGAINGTRGKLMFDLGDARTLTIDTHTVPIAGGIVVGKGFFGSGQSFVTERIPQVESFSLGDGPKFQNITDVLGHPGLPIEQHIAPDFIGWIGLQFFKGYVLKLDYGAPAATLYRDDASGAGMGAAIRGERVVRTIPLGNQAHPNLSTFPVTLGDAPFTGIIDSGSHNTIWLTDAQFAATKRAGVLHENGDGTLTITGLSIDGLLLPPMTIEITHAKPPFAQLLPDPGAPLITLGYEFLRLYKTVWDFDRGSLRLLANPTR